MKGPDYKTHADAEERYSPSRGGVPVGGRPRGCDVAEENRSLHLGNIGDNFGGRNRGFPSGF